MWNNLRNMAAAAVGMLAAIALAILRYARFLIRWLFRGAVAAFLVVLLVNLLLPTPRDKPYRALDPQSALCRDGADAGWAYVARPGPLASPEERANPESYVSNDEQEAIRTWGPAVERKLACSIQHHIIPASGAAGEVKPIGYHLAFVEFQENGKPYVLREPCERVSAECPDDGEGPAQIDRTRLKSQLTALLTHLKSTPGPHYVLVFIHGWRHDASIGDENVGNLRHYAAHAARFIEDRYGAGPAPGKPSVTAIYVGWRGARTRETWLKDNVPWIGENIATFLAAGTLFDRKPVSEAIAPSVLSSLHLIERELGFTSPLPKAADVRQSTNNRMIVFGHSLGGNLLATALKDELIKKVQSHEAGAYMPPVLGDLVVLINPASEATKWTDVQRAVWGQMATDIYERRPIDDFIASHEVFPSDQRPIVISATAARDWPPGGRRETDCDPRSAVAIPVDADSTQPATGEQAEFAKKLSDKDVATASQKLKESAALTQTYLYDWATYDLFPAFKGDFRPAADTIERLLTKRDPHDACNQSPLSWRRKIVSAVPLLLADLLRNIPFQQTDPEQTHTIGNFDPPRAARGRLKDYYVSARPFGTTHELRGLTQPDPRRRTDPHDHREIPVDYQQIVTPFAVCPSARAWLSNARDAMVKKDRHSHSMYWTSDDAGPDRPALQFVHGFTLGGVAAITRANDPFWNVRAFDTALAKHDGYMLSSFICAMNQLVLDEITTFPAPAAGSEPSAIPAPATAE